MLIKAGDVCGIKQNPNSKYSIYDNISTVELYGGISQIDTLVKSSEFDLFPVPNKDNEQAEIAFQIFPNPNNGEFFIRANCPLDKGDIRIYGVMGNELQFELYKDKSVPRIVLVNNYFGVLFVRYQNNGISGVSKLMVK